MKSKDEIHRLAKGAKKSAKIPESSTRPKQAEKRTTFRRGAISRKVEPTAAPTTARSSAAANTRHLPRGKENLGLKASRLAPHKHKTQSPRRTDLAEWSAAMESEFEDLTGQLDDMRRQSLRPGLRGDDTGTLPTSASRPALRLLSNASVASARLQMPQNSGAQRQLDSKALLEDHSSSACAAGLNGASSTLEALARELFDNSELIELFDNGLNAQLKRTKDGATDKSRIEELAGIVRCLRQGLKELQSRAKAFRDASIKHEKEATAKIERITLAGESSSRKLEAEVAGLRRDVAQANAAHKRDLASWQVELDIHIAEAGHLKREMSRLEAERDKAVDEARKAQQLRAEAEGNAKGVQKEAGQQLRNMQVDQGKAARTIREMQDAHAAREAKLQEEKEGIKGLYDEALARSRELETELSSLRGELWTRGEELALVVRQKEALERDCQKLAAGLAEHEQLHLEVSERSNFSANEAALLQQRCAALAAELASRDALLAAAEERAEAQADDFASESGRLRAQMADSKVSLEAAMAGKDKLLQEVGHLHAALATAQSQAEQANGALAKASENTAMLQAQLERHQKHEAEATEAAAESKERLALLENDLAASRVKLEAEVAARLALAEDASAKASRLARLEGEFEAMQDAIGTGSVDQAEMLGRLISRVAALEAAVAESHQSRRELHNQLVHMRGNIRVFCRIKPHLKPALVCLPDGSSVKAEIDGKEQSFAFDKVFGASSTQQAVFDEVAELVQSALDGYQVCLFSYGQTGAGKTHTMQGSRSQEGQGIIPRAVVKILDEAAALREKGWEYELEATFVEVYNETLRDLLAEGKGRDVGKLPEANVIKHHPAGGPSTVVGAVRTKITSAEEAAALVKRASAARSVEATAMNATSSRSHSIFMLYITGHHPGSSTHLLGGLNLVDLAGSERLHRSLAEGQRQKEACSINKSLSALGDVFSALSARNPHVPYRNSKLTHLLQPCLGGDGKTLMFVNVSPEAASLHETVCSLRFAAKVNACQTAARGGARRHVSTASDTRASLQAGNRQSTISQSAKRKAPAAAASKSCKPRMH